MKDTRGIAPAPITSMNEDEFVSREGHVVGAGAQGVFAVGPAAD